jgi:major vault protein
MAEGRSGDLVLSQGTYVLLQDGATGQVEVVTGPHKVSLADTDKPVVYEKDTRRFTPTSADRAISVCPAADEGQYLVLTNPSKEDNGMKHPGKGKQPTMDLTMGRKINIQGPTVFALFPGQVAEVVDGHQLKSNEYLLIRIYAEKEAKENLKNATVKLAEGTEVKAKSSGLFDEKDIRTGNLLIIKGTDVSFYIPPTGIEVLEDGNGRYTRDAVTLERLEYCILLDQNGDKRYVKGPDVVFPKPTEVFIENKGQKTFRALELNENMGIYIKVIADYTEDKKSYMAGEELFITGNEQKIYFPRAEHAIVKYGTETMHYATAVPSGEGRYILDKITGEVKLVFGPMMLLPDPRKEVIVKRILNDRTIQLWFPGNAEALQYNQALRAAAGDSAEEFVEDTVSTKLSRGATKKTLYSSAIAGYMDDEMTRKTEYTKPRTIKLDTKYEGAVLINVWPNFAVQVVNKTGDRKVVEGPKVIMLAYDETLEVLELSTGKPKTDQKLLKTTYLQTKNNVVSDIVTVETKDLISVDVRLSYKVDFEGDAKKWFNVSDYVKLLTQHMRSLIRNVAKKTTVQDFNDNATDIIRDTILGEPGKDGKPRSGRIFPENGMRIYDVEVLNVEIGDEDIAEMLVNNQHDIVEQNLNVIKLEKDLEFTKKSEEFVRAKLDEQIKTNNKKTEVALINTGNESKLATTQFNNAKDLESAKLLAESEKQETLDAIKASELERQNQEASLRLGFDKEKSNIRIKEIEAEMRAITPGLIEAIVSMNDVKLADTLARNLKEQKGGGLADLFGKSGGFEGLLETVKGTPLFDRLTKIHEDYLKMKGTNTKSE